MNDQTKGRGGGGKVGGRETSHFLFGSKIPMMRRAVSALMCGAWQCVVLCGHWLQPRDLVSASVGGQICKEQIEREIGDGQVIMMSIHPNDDLEWMNT